MTRAEEAALKVLPNYPLETYADEDEYIEVESVRSMQVESVRSMQRAFYRKGYEQAEKDLVLTWKDMRKISRILDMIVDDDIKGKIPEEWGDEEYYEEVLRRYNKAKEETK